MGAELFHAEGRTDGRTNMTRLIFALRNFAKNACKLVPALIALSRIGILSLTVNITGTEYIFVTYLFIYLGLSTVLISAI
jgi:hypothetical protein